jgi:hypothetical protein
VTNILFGRAPSANTRLLAEWLPMSKTTIYKRRKRGTMLLQQLDRIENQFQHQAAQNDLRWVELFRRFGGLRKAGSAEEDETRTKP